MIGWFVWLLGSEYDNMIGWNLKVWLLGSEYDNMIGWNLKVWLLGSENNDGEKFGKCI